MIPAPSELLIIAGVALLLFGPTKLPQLGSAIGESIRNFRKGMKPIDGSEDAPENSQALLNPTSSQTPSATHIVVEQVKSDSPS